MKVTLITDSIEVNFSIESKQKQVQLLIKTLHPSPITGMLGEKAAFAFLFRLLLQNSEGMLMVKKAVSKRTIMIFIQSRPSFFPLKKKCTW